MTKHRSHHLNIASCVAGMVVGGVSDVIALPADELKRRLNSTKLWAGALLTELAVLLWTTYRG